MWQGLQNMAIFYIFIVLFAFVLYVGGTGGPGYLLIFVRENWQFNLTTFIIAILGVKKALKDEKKEYSTE